MGAERLAPPAGGAWARVGAGPSPHQHCQAVSSSQQGHCGSSSDQSPVSRQVGSGAPGLRKPNRAMAPQGQQCPLFSLSSGVGRRQREAPDLPHVATPCPLTCLQPQGTAPTDDGTGKASTHGCSETGRPPHAYRSCVCSVTAGPRKCPPRLPGTCLCHQAPRSGSPGTALHGRPWRLSRQVLGACGWQRTNECQAWWLAQKTGLRDIT